MCGWRFLVRPFFLSLCLLIALGWPSLATAHRLGESYIYFQVTEDGLTGRFEALAQDIDTIIPLDSDGDGEITTAEVRAKGDEIFRFFADRLELVDSGRTLELAPGAYDRLKTKHGPFVQIGFTLPGLDRVPEELSIDYAPPADVLNPAHLGYALIESNTRTGVEDNEYRISLIFQPGDGPQTLHLAGEPWTKVLLEFIEHGIWHIWLGFDHVIFLVTLLLPSVMMASAGRWVPQDDFPSSFWSVVKIVTVFTLSHSVTLCLSALGILEMPTVLVEAVIAISIAAVAVLNMFPSAHRYVLLVVFVFGLFHGFGFANVLEPLGAAPGQKALALAGFNVGVEIGQVAIVAVAFPILWLLRRWRFYPAVAFRGATVVLVAIAGLWLLERTTSFDINVGRTVRAVVAYLT